MKQTKRTGLLARSFSSLGDRNYRWYWLGTIASVFAIQMEMLTRGWLVFDLTKSPLALGMVSVAVGAPMIFLSPLGGIATDRFDKKAMLMATQAMPAVVNLALVILIVLGLIQPWHLLISAFFSGINFSFNIPARQAFVAELVPKRDMVNAVALAASGMNFSRIAGPALAGLSIGLIGVANVYLVVVFLFALAILFLLPIDNRASVAPARGQNIYSDLMEGLSYLRANMLVMTLLATALVFMLLGLPYFMLLPAFAADVLKVGSEGLGLLSGVSALGALVGSLAVASWGSSKRQGRLQLYGAMSFCLTLIAFSLSRSLYLSLAILFFTGLFAAVFQALNTATVQMYVPPQMQGRVLSVYSMGWGLPSLGVLPLSLLAEATSTPFAIGLAAVILLLFLAAIFVLRPAQRNL